jgi:hypothetical protein
MGVSIAALFFNLSWSAATRHSEVLALEGESICDRMERAAEIGLRHVSMARESDCEFSA